MKSLSSYQLLLISLWLTTLCTSASLLRRSTKTQPHEESPSLAKSSSQPQETQNESARLGRQKQQRKHNSFRKRKQQLFTNPSSPELAAQRVNIDQSLQTMAGEIHSLLAQTLAHSNKRRSLDRVSLTDDLTGVSFQTQEDKPSCTLEGKVHFTTTRVSGMDSFLPTQLELVPGSEDYEAMVDDQGRTTGYKWIGVWKVVANVDYFKMDVTSQVNVDACGSPLDFTSFGGLAVNQTVMEAAVRVEGELTKDLSGAMQIESAEVLHQNVEFQHLGQMGGLQRNLPLNFDDEMHNLVQFIFQKKLANPVLTTAPATSTTTAR